MAIFKELIGHLKRVKKDSDITIELAHELTITGIETQMSIILNDNPEMTHQEAFIITRSLVLQSCDELFLEAMTNDMEDMDDDLQEHDGMLFGHNSPMNDKVLRSGMKAVIDDYNDKIDKKK